MRDSPPTSQPTSKSLDDRITSGSRWRFRPPLIVAQLRPLCRVSNATLYRSRPRGNDRNLELIHYYANSGIE